MSPLGVFAVAGLGTYLIRVSIIALAGRLPEPSDEVLATLRLIAPAVLAAIVADRLFVDEGAVALRLDWLVAAVVAGLVALRFRSAAITMAAGMGVVWAIAAIT